MKEQNFDEIVNKFRNICSQKELCKFDIKKKLYSSKINISNYEKLVEILEDENFINESRFAKAFAKDKFKFNKWGKKRIFLELKSRKISENIISEAINCIDFDEYRKIVENEIHKKINSTKHNDSIQLKQKILNFALQRGYEIDLTIEILNKKNK